MQLSTFHICSLLISFCYETALGINADVLHSGDQIEEPSQENVDYVEKFDDEEVESFNSDNVVFVATNKWQVIKPGQSIPRGLHVRMNFQTGIKEAKLLDPDDVTDKSQGLVLVEEKHQAESEVLSESVDTDHEKMKYLTNWYEDGTGMSRHKHFTKRELKDALKKFKPNMVDDVKDKEQAEKVRQKHRSIAELRNDLKHMNMKFETDTEIMQRLVKQYKQEGASVQQRVNILLELEYYVHQIDNGQNLQSINGFRMVVEGLNDSQSEIREACAFVLGSAFQSNPKVQIHGLDEGAMHLLLNLMYRGQPYSTQKKALYALSALIRNFPYAQYKFKSLGGIAMLSLLLQQDDVNSIPIQTRVIILLNDLVTEHKWAQEMYQKDSSNRVAEQRLEQYKKVNVSFIIRDQGCPVLRPLSSPDHDVREKVLVAVNNLLFMCKEQFIAANLIKQLSDMREDYQELVKEEQIEGDSDTFFAEILALLDNILSQLILKDYSIRISN